MNLSSQIHPSSAQFQALINDYPKDQPVVMINILKFKEKSGNGEETGQEAYARYSMNVLPFLKKAEGRLLWSGTVHNTVVGSEDGKPDMVLLVQYPSINNFVKMATDPEYLKIANDRTIGLEYGGLLASSTLMNGFQ